MVSVHRYHEISEARHRVLNPLSTAKLLLLGELCGVRTGARVLDLACGKGELLCRLAERHGAGGIGIDIHPPFVADARARAEELGVAGSVRFVEGDAAQPAGLEGSFDLVCCIGATWIGGGLEGTLALMREWSAPGGTLLVGDVYWAAPPSEETRRRMEQGQTFDDLGGTLARLEAAGTDLVEMVLASTDDWDRHAASQWRSVADWLLANPDDPERDEVRALRDAARRDYLVEERRVLGWGVFVLRPDR